MPLNDAEGFHWLLITADLRDHCYLVYDSSADTAKGERAALVNSAVRMTLLFHIASHVEHMCSYHTLINVMVAESGSRTGPYALVHSCASAIMGTPVH